MFCPNCGKTVKDGATFCENCGAKLAAPKAPDPVPPVQKIVVEQPPITKETLPAQFRPLSAWAYFGYSLLFAIPVVGFVFLIVFTFNGSNINRRSFARSYWCGLILVAVIVLVILLIAALSGGISALVDWIRSLF